MRETYGRVEKLAENHEVCSVVTFRTFSQRIISWNNINYYASSPLTMQKTTVVKINDLKCFSLFTKVFISIISPFDQ
jgi:hypothetical protein